MGVDLSVFGEASVKADHAVGFALSHVSDRSGYFSRLSWRALGSSRVRGLEASWRLGSSSGGIASAEMVGY